MIAKLIEKGDICSNVNISFSIGKVFIKTEVEAEKIRTGTGISKFRWISPMNSARIGTIFGQEETVMRIIAGEYKGRRLESPADYSVRPTTDKVKEALFSILTDKIWGSSVLDLFSGTGNLGIEALSRGAARCIFGDNSRESIRLIKSNIAHCKAQEGARVIPGDFKKVLLNLDEKFDVILLDPPYGKGYLEPCFELIAQQGLLAEDGIIVAEHRKEEELPDDFYGFRKIKERKYGVIKLSIYHQDIVESDA